jgi:uncharacterized tellurite resistance protein B-like protein
VSILKFLGFDKPPAGVSAETESVRKIADALDRLEPERARFIAAFAYVLSRVARADQTVSPEETRVMEELVCARGGLPPEHAVIVVQIAKTQNLLFGGTEDFLVTREFERLATPEQKLALLECLFAVSSADESIATIEDNEIRRISVEVRIPHDEYIRVKSGFRDRLEVLRRKTE